MGGVHIHRTFPLNSPRVELIRLKNLKAGKYKQVRRENSQEWKNWWKYSSRTPLEFCWLEPSASTSNEIWFHLTAFFQSFTVSWLRPLLSRTIFLFPLGVRVCGGSTFYFWLLFHKLQRRCVQLVCTARMPNVRGKQSTLFKCW